MARQCQLIGQRFGMLVVIAQAPHTRETRWHCKCDCGGKTISRASNLKRGYSTNCGCQRNAKNAQRLRQGHADGGLYHVPESRERLPEFNADALAQALGYGRRIC